MGIPGLLPALKDFMQTDAHIHQFKGRAIAIDTSSWLHKAVYSVAHVYVEAEEEGRIDSHTVQVAASYLLQRCYELIVHANLSKIYLVMDGQHRCPLKTVTHQERKRKRALALEKARQAASKEAAYQKYKACIHISNCFTQAVLKKIRQNRLFHERRIEIVQSPHEADAQLVQLATSGRVSAIITEDSDVLVYATAAMSDVTVIYKLDRHRGTCHTIKMDWLWQPSECLASAKGAKSTQQQTWKTLQARERVQPGAGRRMFVQACVLTGCDYAPSELSGVGIVKAFAVILSNFHLSTDQRFESIVRCRLSPRSLAVSYVNKLRQAEAVFYYHPIRDPDTNQLEWLTNGNDPYAPAFPTQNLAILGNPEELTHLTLPGTKTSSKHETAAMVSINKAASPVSSKNLPLDPASVDSTSSKNTFEESKDKTRFCMHNPYRKRSLPPPQTPSQKMGNSFNPFTRFSYMTEKENTNNENRPNTICPSTRSPPSRVNAKIPTIKDNANESDNNEKDPASYSIKVCRIRQSTSPHFSGSSFSTTPKSGHASPRIPRTKNGCSEIVDPSELDFYDTWLSPKADSPQQGVEIEESPSPKKQPLAPQGALRFRLAGLSSKRGKLLKNNIRLGRCRTPNPTTSSTSVTKLISQSKRTGTLLDHFRVKKRKFSNAPDG